MMSGRTQPLAATARKRGSGSSAISLMVKVLPSPWRKAQDTSDAMKAEKWEWRWLRVARVRSATSVARYNNAQEVTEITRKAIRSSIPIGIRAAYVMIATASSTTHSADRK